MSRAGSSQADRGHEAFGFSYHGCVEREVDIRVVR